MKLYLIRRPYDRTECRNSNNTHGVLALGDDEAEAGTNARAAATSGETKLHDAWEATELAEAGTLPGNRLALWLGEVFEDARRPV